MAETGQGRGTRRWRGQQKVRGLRRRQPDDERRCQVGIAGEQGQRLSIAIGPAGADVATQEAEIRVRAAVDNL